MNQFKLIIDGDSIRKHDINILKENIHNLNKEDGNFIILEPKRPINNSIYLQAAYDVETNVYLTEIRFIFDSDSDYKHYSTIIKDQETLFKIFQTYYLEDRTPDIKEWKDNTPTFDNNLDVDMIKLYRKNNDTIHYFEVWLNEDNISLTTHKGVLGDVGETEDVFYDEEDDLPVKVGMAKIVSDLKLLGYSDNISHTEIVVQFSYKDNEDMSMLVDKRQHIEALLNECLGWTGNGHCDGGDIGSGSMNLFCYVINKDIALQTILEMLEEENYLEGVSIAFADEKTEEYRLLYPRDKDFRL